MKKSLLLVWLTMLLWLPLFTSADGFKTITLAPWWNVVSTPWVLSSISYSNWWWGLSFFKLVWGNRQSVAWNITNIKPLQWFLVNNSNSSDVIMSLRYSPQTVMWATLTNNVSKWWNLLWITDTNSLSAVYWDITVDFTNNWTTNLLNKVNDNYKTYYSYNVANPQIWEAYWVYMSYAREYWWVNNPIWDTISCKTNYNTKQPTSGNVIVTLTECTWGETILNGDTYTFTDNWDHIFEYKDKYWNEWTYKVTVNWIDRVAPICNTITYSPATPTRSNVTATLADCSETVYWNKSYTFTQNWEHTFEYRDAAGNTNQKTATVYWMDTVAPECEVSYSPSTYTTWPVTVQLTCNEEIKEPLTYTYTWNTSRYIQYTDLLWNYASQKIDITWIQTETTLETSSDIYLNTITSPAASPRIVMLEWKMTWEDKDWRWKYTISPNFQLHIRNAWAWTPLTQLVDSLYIDWCEWESDNFEETDANWNADVNVNFDCLNKDIYDLPKDIKMWIGFAWTAPLWAKFYVDNLDETNLLFNDNVAFVITSWEIKSRIIEIGYPELNLSSNDLPQSVRKWNENSLIFDWVLSTDQNEIDVTKIRVRWSEDFNDKLDLKLYVWDELISTSDYSYSYDSVNFQNWLATFSFTDNPIRVYSWESKNIKIYGWFYSSLPVWLTFTPTVSVYNAKDENDKSLKTYPSIVWNKFLLYDIYSYLDFRKTDNIDTYTTRNYAENVLLFKWLLSSSAETTNSINVSSIKLENDNDSFDTFLTVHLYVDWVEVWEWILNNWEITFNTNINIDRNTAALVELYWDTACKTPGWATLNQTISITATQWWEDVIPERLPTVTWWQIKTSDWRIDSCPGFWD